ASQGLQRQQQPTLTSENLPSTGTLLDLPTDSLTSTYSTTNSLLDESQSSKTDTRSRINSAHVKLLPLSMSGYANPPLSPCGHERPLEGSFCHICGRPIPQYGRPKATSALYSSARRLCE